MNHEHAEESHRTDLARAVKATPKPKGSRLEKLRSIATEWQCARVEGKLVDATTARACVLVHDALNEANREKLLAMPLPKMVAVVWKLVA